MGDCLVLVSVIQNFSVEIDVEICFSLEKSLLFFGLKVRLLADQEADHFKCAGNAVDSDVSAHVVRIGRQKSFKV